MWQLNKSKNITTHTNLHVHRETERKREIRSNIDVALYIVKAVQQLVREGADVNARSNDGMTPLAIAAFWGYADIVKVLLENGSVGQTFWVCFVWFWYLF